MKRQYLFYAVVPGLILLVVTVVRAWLEITDPESTLTHLASVNYTLAVVLILWPILLLKEGVSLGRYLGIMAVLLFLARLPVAIVYTMAYVQNWSVEATGEPVRYVAQVTAEGATPSSLAVFLGTFLFPFTSMLLVSLILWSVVWAVGFRSRRPFAAAASA